MASTVIKNWDNKTWLSSQNYIKSFNNFLIRNIKINSNSKILDIIERKKTIHYNRITKHMKNYKHLYRDNFLRLSDEIVNYS